MKLGKKGKGGLEMEHFGGQCCPGACRVRKEGDAARIAGQHIPWALGRTGNEDNA